MHADSPAPSQELPLLRGSFGLLAGRIALLFLLLLPGLGLALVLGSSAEPVADGGTQGGWLLSEVNASRPITQSFVVTRDRLVGVQLQLFRSGLHPELNDEPVLVRLRTTLRPGPDLASATLRVQDLNPVGPTMFRFAGFSYSPVFPAEVVDSSLYILVEAPTLPPGSGLMIAGTSTNYHDGVLRIGEQRFTHFDLAFTPMYGPLVGDRYLPLSRLAQDRPGLLGWPPLYILLPYVYTLAVAATLWQLGRRLRRQHI